MTKPTTGWEPPTLTLGWRLRWSLENAGLKQEDMAAQLESHRTTLTRWMHDEIVPKRLYLKIWAETTGVPFEWFEEAIPVSEPPAASPRKPEQPSHTSRRRRVRGPSTRWDMDPNDDAWGTYSTTSGQRLDARVAA